jgi:ATP/maltotriose-dependent transcriptional regulator MalT/DNA-binding SARP family transcriptional activator
VSAQPPQRAVLGSKLTPPAIRRFVIPRPRVESLLGAVADSRLTTVVAGAGFGKSSLLASWAVRHGASWYTVTEEDRDLDAFVQGVLASLRQPGVAAGLSITVTGVRGPDAERAEAARARAYAAVLGGALQEALRGDLVLVLDDVDELGQAAGSVRFLEGLCRQAPERLHLVMAARRDPPFSIERLRGRGQVLELAGPTLAFDEAEVAELLTGLLGESAAPLAPLLRAATGGWPAAVRLAAEALQGTPPERWEAAVGRLARREGPIDSYLAEEVFGNEPPEVSALVRAVAPLEGFTAELAEALGVERAREHVAAIDRRGLFLESRGDGWYTLAPLVRAFARERLPLDPDDHRRTCLTAAAWLEAHGEVGQALGILVSADQLEPAARLLVSAGRALLASGAAELVIRVANRLPHDREIDRLAGEAYQVRGEWDLALERYGRVTGEGDIDAGLAWRTGVIHYLRGEPDLALEMYRRGRLGSGEPRDDALLLAWTAAAHWLRGEVDACREQAGRALEVAEACGDDQALATAYTALAMHAALMSDRRANFAHYQRALEHAERAGDVLQVIRIRANRGSHLIEESNYREALEELDIAIRLAELAGFASFQALAMSNRGEALFRLGRLDEAIADLEGARAIQQRLGSRLISYPLGHLGDVFLERGDLALARLSFQEAVVVSEGAGDMQGLVPALAGLARVLVVEEPEEAARTLERALSHGSVLGRQKALLSAGWVALVIGDSEAAARWAEEAAALSRTRRDRAAVAESLELVARTSPDPATRRDRLEEAGAIWREVGSALGEARVDLALARSAPPEEAVELGRRAQRRFLELGVRGYAAEVADLLEGLSRPRSAPVAVHSLGGFRVTREGEPVPLAEWQSRKARTLLKILVARRGRPAHREEVMELLWPDEDPERTSSRLSVALSTLRGVLDPHKRADAEHFVGADRMTVRLELEHLEVDVERFLEDAEAGLRSLEAGLPEEAVPRLVAAEAAYAGDFLPEDPFDDWAIPLREEARNAYVAVARALAEDSAGRGDHDGAARLLLRILERDAFDERAHLGLVSALVVAGRHGEARRAYRAYAARMEELAIEALPFTEALGRVRPADPGPGAGSTRRLPESPASGSHPSSSPRG